MSRCREDNKGCKSKFRRKSCDKDINITVNCGDTTPVQCNFVDAVVENPENTPFQKINNDETAPIQFTKFTQGGGWAVSLSESEFECPATGIYEIIFNFFSGEFSLEDGAATELEISAQIFIDGVSARLTAVVHTIPLSVSADTFSVLGIFRINQGQKVQFVGGVVYVNGNPNDLLTVSNGTTATIKLICSAQS